MEYSWSKYCQNPAQLDASRIISLTDDTKQILQRYLPQMDEVSIADIGCGTGIFTLFLGQLCKNCHISGVDYDVAFVEEAKKRSLNCVNNSYEFIVGDGYRLPFEDNQFDLVVSHTYLTSVADPKRALAEKIRIAKKGGLVVSITAQSFTRQQLSPGNYRNDYLPTYCRYLELRKKIEHMYLQQDRANTYVNTTVAEYIPQLFGESGLRKISIHPIGFTFSLSDYHLSHEIKERYVKQFCEGEIQKLHSYVERGNYHHFVSENEILEYQGLLKQHRQYLLDSIGENVVWEWMSGLNIMMIGEKPLY